MHPENRIFSESLNPQNRSSTAFLRRSKAWLGAVRIPLAQPTAKETRSNPTPQELAHVIQGRRFCKRHRPHAPAPLALIILDQFEPAIAEVVTRREAPVERTSPCIQIATLTTAGREL